MNRPPRPHAEFEVDVSDAQVAFFRDRWECSAIGTVIFTLSVVMLVPYMIISIMGGGRVLHDISGGRLD